MLEGRGDLSHLARRNPNTQAIHGRFLLPLENLQETFLFRLISHMVETLTVITMTTHTLVYSDSVSHTLTHTHPHTHTL